MCSELVPIERGNVPSKGQGWGGPSTEGPRSPGGAGGWRIAWRLRGLVQLVEGEDLKKGARREVQSCREDEALISRCPQSPGSGGSGGSGGCPPLLGVLRVHSMGQGPVQGLLSSLLLEISQRVQGSRLPPPLPAPTQALLGAFLGQKPPWSPCQSLSLSPPPPMPRGSGLLHPWVGRG